MPIPKIVHQFWEGEKPEDIQQMMRSVRRFHPEWEIKLWNSKNIGYPLNMDFDDLISKCQNYASLSNIVRLRAVHKFGGIWIDSDCQVLKPLTPLLDHIAFAALQDDLIINGVKGRICNACFGAEAGNGWVNWQIDRQAEMQDADAAKAIYIMSEAPRDGVTILPTSYFFPWLWNDPIEKRVPKKESYMQHFWKGSWAGKKS